MLIWTLWVLPIAASVDAADSRPLGATFTVELEAGERVGVWSQGISASLGTTECTVTAPDDSRVAQRGAPALDWDDTLWWMTPKRGFAQMSQVTAATTGDHRIRCEDSLDTYDGAFLVAGDSFGGGSIGLGRGGGADYAVGTMLAFGAVFLPPFAVGVTIIVLVRTASARRSARRSAPPAI
ncbi:hypothetical protein [Microbacterium sp. PMB16]|uniref:hypothetical protein n=1 Tax=Microbacterium sp. PMB16 TaxID=3120157 RepID=UPI003F4C2718